MRSKLLFLGSRLCNKALQYVAYSLEKCLGPGALLTDLVSCRARGCGPLGSQSLPIPKSKNCPEPECEFSQTPGVPPFVARRDVGPMVLQDALQRADWPKDFRKCRGSREVDQKAVKPDLTTPTVNTTFRTCCLDLIPLNTPRSRTVGSLSLRPDRTEGQCWSSTGLFVVMVLRRLVIRLLVMLATIQHGTYAETSWLVCV